MKRTLTRMISAVCAAALGSGCMAIGADAKVIEPEIVKTESWTTSYYIDDDMDTLYPYIQCEADIYNDGTIKLYMWNTHEWDGFATVEHEVTLEQTALTKAITTNSIPFSIKYGVSIDYDYSFWADNQTVTRKSARFISDTDFSNIDLSYIDSRYSLFVAGTGNTTAGYLTTSGNKDHGASTHGRTVLKRSYNYALYDERWDGSYPNYSNLPSYGVVTALPNLVAYSERPKIVAYRLTPNEDPTGTYNFRLFGHDITITPELLSGSIVAEPKQTEQEQKIKALEAENAALKATISAFDADADSLLTAADAQAVLNYYVAHLAGKTTGKVSDYAEYSKQKG